MKSLTLITVLSFLLFCCTNNSTEIENDSEQLDQDWVEKNRIPPNNDLIEFDYVLYGNESYSEEVHTELMGDTIVAIFV